MEVVPLLTPIVQDPELSALEKLNRYCSTAGRWKIAKKTFILELLRVWLADENAIVRQKLFAMSVKRVKPLLTEIIRQGIREGVLTTSYPDQASEVVYSLMVSLGNTFGEMVLSYEPECDHLQQLETILAAYTDALERVLGAPRSSIVIIDDKTLKEWFVSAGEKNLVQSELLHTGIGVIE
jgi:phenylpyruvate tautomerase PptA (4-oxalocrotonate tautomerase family)